MGGSSSKQDQEKKSLLDSKSQNEDYDDPSKRIYSLPFMREKTRFEYVEKKASTSTYEAGIDKYDYVIIFKLTSITGAHQHPKVEKTNLTGDGLLGNLKNTALAQGVTGAVGDVLNAVTGAGPKRITWRDCERIWKKAAPGSEAEKEKQRVNLVKFWKQRASMDPLPDDEIRIEAWQTVAREAIIDHLVNRTGLQCKLSATPTAIYCRIRAPVALLELQADKENYKLQLRGEVDPGAEQFWNKELLQRIDSDDEEDTGQPKGVRHVAVELEDEAAVYSKTKCVQILTNLYKANKISPNELGIKDETEAEASLRVHTLERIVDKVPVYNKFPAYADYSTRPEKRHLFNTYNSVRGRTLFRAKDRLYLTKSVLDNHFNFEILKKERVIEGIQALHDANRGEDITREVLKKRWVWVLREDRQRVGAWAVSDPAYESSTPCSFFDLPWAQPLTDIRDYFGEQIALHFAWLSCYSYTLRSLFLFSLAMCLIVLYRGYADVTDGYDFPSYAYQLIVVFWSEWYQASWVRENEVIKLKWGTYRGRNTEKVRASFEGVGELVYSAINNKKEPQFPTEHRRARVVGSYAIIALLILLDLGLIAFVFVLQYKLETMFPVLDRNVYACWVQSFVHAFILQLLAKMFPRFVTNLNEYENYKTESENEDALIYKTLFFQVTNNYAAATFTIFGKDAVFDNCLDSDSCLPDLRILLLAIVFVRAFLTIYDFLEQRLSKLYTYCCGSGSTLAEIGRQLQSSMANDTGNDEEKGALLSADLDDFDDDKTFMDEVESGEKLKPFPGVFDNYSESVLQFGFVSMFSVAMPLLAVYAMAENLILMRVKAYKLCQVYIRPHVRVVEDIGSWLFYIQFLSYMGVIWQVAITMFGGPNFYSTDIETKFVVFLIAVPLLLFAKTLMQVILPKTDEYIETIAARNDFVYQKYVQGFQDDDDNLDMSSIKGNVHDRLRDVDGITLYDIRRSARVSEDEYEEMRRLESLRRDYRGHLAVAKEELSKLYEFETFNENTGVGETKHNLALGRLSVNVLMIEHLGPEYFDHNDDVVETISASNKKSNRKTIAVEVKLLPTRQGVEAAPEFDRKDCVSEPTYVCLDNSDLGKGAGKFGCNPGQVKFPMPSNSNMVMPGTGQKMGPYAPIKTIDAEARFAVLLYENVRNKDASYMIAYGTVPLRELQDQEEHRKTITLKRYDGSIGHARLFLKLRFEYSKVKPARRKIFHLQGKLRKVEKDLANVKAGVWKLARDEEVGC